MDLTKNTAYYSTMIINMFAKRFKISMKDAWQYLNRYKGMSFLLEHYNINHTLNSDDVVDDLVAICKKEGGNLV